MVYLHSTMLLLYHEVHPLSVWKQSNLHSTMLLLYLSAPVCHMSPSASFTFHYASTLSSTGRRRRSCGNRIYIPLCFYFITTRTHSQKASWSNLHSTMLLLYQTPVGFTPFVSMYLHSTMLLLYHVVLAPCAFSANIFTFHYASTLSSAFLSSFCNFQIIYIPLCFYFIYAPDRTHNKNTYLHSTMLLLYLTRYLLSML